MFQRGLGEGAPRRQGPGRRSYVVTTRTQWGLLGKVEPDPREQNEAPWDNWAHPR